MDSSIITDELKIAQGIINQCTDILSDTSYKLNHSSLLYYENRLSIAKAYRNNILKRMRSTKE